VRSYDSASATYCKGRHEVNSFSAPVFLLRFVHQFKITLKAFANFSPGFERSENPGTLPNDELKPCKGSSQGEPFQGSALVLLVYPGLSLALQPWARVSERLRRNSNGHTTPARHLEVEVIYVIFIAWKKHHSRTVMS